MDEKKTGTIMQIVRLKTELSEEELLKIAKVNLSLRQSLALFRSTI